MKVKINEKWFDGRYEKENLSYLYPKSKILYFFINGKKI